MNELIKITEQNGQKAVSARELHLFLESKQEFTNWIKGRIKKYGFIENVDFEVFDNFIKNPDGGRPLSEYALTLDTAKELAMVEGNAKGKEARQYFIACEKKLKEVARPQFQLPQTYVEALRELADVSETVEKQKEVLAIQAPKIEYYDGVLNSSSLMPTTIIAKGLGMSAITLNKKLNELGIIYKKSGIWVLYHKYQDKGYTGVKTYLHDDGEENKTYQHTYWTEKGRRFIYEILG